MENIVDRLNEKIAEKHLLKHPFYQAWQRGELTFADLIRYGIQRYPFEADFPHLLRSIVHDCRDDTVREIILENLWDEESGRENHRILWLNFCEGLGLDERAVIFAGIYPESADLMRLYRSICCPAFPTDTTIGQSLAAIYVYEKQVPKISQAKLQGLTEFYGVTNEKALEFFTIHSKLDVGHSLAEARALEHYISSYPSIYSLVDSAADKALDAWWSFLDGIESRRMRVRSNGEKEATNGSNL